MNMKKGFTLIETFVAISILLISLSGPLSIAAQALRSAYYARDEITAFYLAQEGLEYVRAVRDQNYLHSPAQPWLTGVDDCESPAGAASPPACQVDFPNFSHSVCVGGTCTPLLIDSNGLFNASTGNPSAFTRTLTITEVAANPTGEVVVGVRVSWVSAGISRSFQLSEHLFDWI